MAASTIVKNDFETPKVGCHIWTLHVPKWHVMPDDGVGRYHEFDDVFKAKLDGFLQNQEKK